MNAIVVLLLPASFFLSVGYGLNYLAIPWVTIFPLIRICYAHVTLKKMKLSLGNMVSMLIHPLGAMLIMLLSLHLYTYVQPQLPSSNVTRLFVQIAFGALGYCAYLLLIRRTILSDIREVWHL